MIRVSSARDSPCFSSRSPNFIMILRLSIGVTFFHAGNAASAAATAASTSSAPARSTSLAIRDPSLGLMSSSFLLFFAGTYYWDLIHESFGFLNSLASLLMKRFFGRLVLLKLKAIMYVCLFGRCSWPQLGREDVKDAYTSCNHRFRGTANLVPRRECRIISENTDMGDKVRM